ncbi:hypothetical protein BC332_06813 [Capsicum chinense]|nr:hypothetical protein BC332_06813 [Capsicum chinense]
MDYDLSDEKKAIDDTKAVVDLSGIEVEDRRQKIVDEIRKAYEKWGFFQVINHGVPSSVLEGMIDGTRKFHEQDVEMKKEYYSSNPIRKVRYDSNLHVYKTKGKTSNWKDTLFIPGVVSHPEEIPLVCRKASLEYINHVTKLADILLGLLSEALGLKPDHLKETECGKGQTLACHYYPILSNDKFVSINHRVIAKKVGPRISVACFFGGGSVHPKMYGPIKELIIEENPPLYKEFLVADYTAKFFSKPLDKTVLDLFRL